MSDAATMFCNRLRKTRKARRKWAKAESTDALREYDRDIPELPYVVERYRDRWFVSIYEGQRPRDLDGDRAVVLAGAEAEHIAPGHVFFRVRARRRPGQQHERETRPKPTPDQAPPESAGQLWVDEGPVRLFVNLDDHLDSGLFLDHRGTRAAVREGAAGQRVLNLFGYTGSFSVHAAQGGARETCTVDLGRGYLRWAGWNLAANGFAPAPLERVGDPAQPAPHRRVWGDSRAFLDEEARRIARGTPGWDAIIVDPPTHSRSKRAPEFSVQRDHAELLRACARVLAPGGTLWFSTNDRGFALDATVARELAFVEQTPGSLPPDVRDRAIHRCWRGQRG